MGEHILNPSEEEEETTQQTQNTEQQQPTPSHITIQTPLDRPEFNFFVSTFMKKMGMTDRKEAAIMLSNMLYDIGLDPTADLKDVIENMNEMKNLIGSLPNTPQSLQVKDTLSAMYTQKAGNLLLDRMNKNTSGDPMADRFEKMLDKYMPYMIFMSSFGKMMNTGIEPSQQQPQQTQPQKIELPDEYKNEMATIREQLKQTQELLRIQAEDKKQQEFASNIINTVNSSMTPQIDAIRTQVESLTATLNAQANAQPPQQSQSSQEMRDIARQIDDLKNNFTSKAEAQKLNLGDVDTILTTLDTIEKRIKREPTGEIDWKASTISTIGEIGKEFVNAYKEIEQSKATVPSQGFNPLGQGSALAPAAAEMKQIVKRQVQQYITNNLSKGINQLIVNDAMKDLNLSPQQIMDAYRELEAEGWVKTTPQSGQTPPTQPPPQPQPTAIQPQPIPQQNNPNPPGTGTNDRFDPNKPFLER